VSSLKFEDVAKEYCRVNGATFVRGVGAGAFKETYEITVPGLGARALKVFGPQCTAERTAREIGAMRQCAHPNISVLTDLGSIPLNGSNYVIAVEEFLPGGTLAEEIGQGALSRDRTLSLGKHLIGAIGHVASHRLVHRDVKPDNILLRTKGGDPVLVDFGLVRALDQVSLTASFGGQGPGTPLYSPPEQLRNEKALIDWRADQFALGVTLSMGRFGFHPYGTPGGDMGDAVAKVHGRRGPSIEFEQAATADGLAVLVEMCKPWPVHRHIDPAALRQAWEGQ